MEGTVLRGVYTQPGTAAASRKWLEYIFGSQSESEPGSVILGKSLNLSKKEVSVGRSEIPRGVRGFGGGCCLVTLPCTNSLRAGFPVTGWPWPSGHPAHPAHLQPQCPWG